MSKSERAREIKHGRVNLFCARCDSLKATNLNNLIVRRTKMDDVVHEWTCMTCMTPNMWTIAGRPISKDLDLIERDPESGAVILPPKAQRTKTTVTKRDPNTGAVISEKEVK